MNIRDLLPSFGSTVDNIDMRTLSDSERAELKKALNERGVLVIREQSLSAAELLEVGRKFGLVEYTVRGDFQHPDVPDVYVISNIVEDGKPLGNPNDGFAWHTDLSFLENPTAFTFLYAIETPPVGANTEFASTQVAYDRLPPAQQDEFDHIRVRHSYEMLHATRRNAAPLSAEELQRMPDVIHPLVRTHPDTARKALYLGLNTSLPVGMDPEEGQKLIEDLMARTTINGPVYSHEWQPGDLVIWDNRLMLHRATDYDKKAYRRLMYRVTVKGERPF
ncbi:TauD/TfdA family dioxygenase [Komagataeibacter xylinus]|uniref:TauD/TfdA dioxygenase family protein n=2 Tax=Komagataeibacter rhaeticus TaxID=215221 RepID=UPI000587CC36|nr:TauD/TfdA family dioxygenase [Komagataeibacter rhaeticus]ATU72768.1 TauD/TfdA family dioxygenase [Komagataeibacter xylinus]WPP22540.1 TauD/TfdA family dioxygenase [Komagataeibacter rhaeticus]SAY48657.1 Alpha-ketoglutarate-dependent 2,4-dichlorophenoxyacetate dioxygenase [Komagataeibacter rhaeticus]